jgi:hypothetical protein
MRQIGVNSQEIITIRVFQGNHLSRSCDVLGGKCDKRMLTNVFLKRMVQNL